MSRVDYCNSLLVDQSAVALRGLHLAQNYAARLVMGLPRRNHVTLALEVLHWLRVCYKLTCLLYKTLYTDDGPAYMSSMVSQYTPGRAGALPAPLCAWLYLAPVWLVQAAASRCQFLLSGMCCLLTFITVGHSRLLKQVLKPVYSGNILVKH